ncbi:MAG: T9SS type A sorting domain-containing protein [Bacteroidota bacterium]
MLRTLLFFTLLGLKLQAQQNYFNKRINLAYAENSRSVFQGSNLYVIGSTSDDGTPHIETRLSAVDSAGNILWNKAIRSLTINYYAGLVGSFSQSPDGGYIVGGGVQDTSGDANGAIYRFDANGDTLWTKVFGDTTFQTFNQCRPTTDGGFIMVGTTATFDSMHDVWLFKTDSMGGMEWNQHYGLTNNVTDEGYSVVQTSDGGYFIGGMRFFRSSLNIDWLLIKTDSLGNEQWEKVFGGQYEDLCWSVSQSFDGSLIGGGIYTDVLHGLPFDPGDGRLNIIKLDTAGNLLWDKKYGPVRYYPNLYSICSLPDGSIMGAGSCYYDTTTNQTNGIVLKVAGNGDSLWYRNYRLLMGNNSDNFLYDIKPTSDSGFIATGPVFPLAPDTGSISDTWLLKLDSLGCEISSCWMNVGNMDENQNQVELQIYPNPSLGLFHIESKVEIENIKVFNYTGEIVFSKSGQISILDLSQNISGIYFYKIATKENKVFSGKLIKE